MASDISAGDLDQRITFLVPVISYDVFNQPVEAFEVFAEVWAARRDVSTTEALRAKEVGAELTARFTVRYSALIARVDARFRIRHKSHDFNIKGVRAVGGRNSWFEIDAATRAESAEAFEVTSP